MLLTFWREWVTENPFLLRSLRQGRRRGHGWKVPLTAAGLPLLALLLLHHFFPGNYRAHYGLLLFSAVALVHVIVFASWTAAGFSLAAEAKTDSLDFIRILPLGRRELLGWIGTARAMARLGVALAALPLYVLLLGYGSVRPADILGLYLLFAALLFAPPGRTEIVTALTSKLGEGAATEGKAQANANVANGFLWFFLYQGVFQAVIMPVIVPLLGAVMSRFQAAVGPELGRMLPFSAVAGAARALVQPQPFYGWVLAPLWPLALYWVLRSACRLVAFAEWWAREPLPVTLADGRKMVLLPETERPDEQRLRRRLETLFSAVLLLTLAGYLWRPLVASGSLGSLAGSARPSGGIAALLVIAGGLALIPAFEAIRGQWLTLRAGLKASVREVAGGLLSVQLRITLVVLAISVLGGVVPWPEPALALVRLLLLTGSALLFAAGWRSALAWQAELPPGRAAVFLGWTIYLLWILTYVAPLLAAARPGLPLAAHYAAVWSPVYGLLSLLPKLWRGTPPLPFALALALPAAIGLLLYRAVPRPRAATVAAPTDRPPRDALEAWLHGLAKQWDNPLFLLALRRQSRQPTGTAARLAFALAGTLVLPLVLVVLPLAAMMSRRGLPLLELLAEPAGRTGYLVGGIAALIAAGLVVLSLGLTVLGGLYAAVQTASTVARQQHRMHFLLVSALSDRQMVLGTLGVVFLDRAPSLLAGLAVSLLWVLVALGYGAPAVWLLSWLLTAGTVVCVSAHAALAGFREWRRRPLWLRVLGVIGAVAGTILFFGGISWALSQSAPWIVRSFGGWLAWLPAGLTAVGLLAGVTLPFSLHRAVKNVHAARVEDDLERAT